MTREEVSEKRKAMFRERMEAAGGDWRHMNLDGLCIMAYEEYEDGDVAYSAYDLYHSEDYPGYVVVEVIDEHWMHLDGERTKDDPEVPKPTLVLAPDHARYMAHYLGMACDEDYEAVQHEFAMAFVNRIFPPTS